MAKALGRSCNLIEARHPKTMHNHGILNTTSSCIGGLKRIIRNVRKDYGRYRRSAHFAFGSISAMKKRTCPRIDVDQRLRVRKLLRCKRPRIVRRSVHHAQLRATWSHTCSIGRSQPASGWGPYWAKRISQFFICTSTRQYAELGIPLKLVRVIAAG